MVPSRRVLGSRQARAMSRTLSVVLRCRPVKSAVETSAMPVCSSSNDFVNCRQAAHDAGLTYVLSCQYTQICDRHVLVGIYFYLLASQAVAG